ncbi:hypothetical protein ACFRJ1_33775 [Streptomyces sp. NPDC056773]|uniref:hypothetical protein n=1 Tax=unclassified Streptomyces TaxID=2593676 RepID=UPI00368A5F2E
MQFKRIAAVAAAAVVGPTVLMTTPAMADEQQPAVSVPDSAPQTDPAPSAGKPKAPAGAGTEAGAKPGAKAGAGDAPSDSMLMGPDVKISGIPEDGFKRGGGWTPLTVTIDNTGHIAVADLAPRISIDRADGKLKSEHFALEYLAEDRTWKSAKWLNPDEPSSMSNFSVGAPRDVPRGSSSTIQVRIRFTAEAPVIAFDMYSDGLSIRPDGGQAWAPATWYKAKIAGAASIPDPSTEGPALRVDGVPENLPVGGWQELSVRVDNSGKKALDRFELYLGVARPDWSRVKPSDFQVQYYGKDGWKTGELQLDDSFVIKQLGGTPIAAGQAFDLKIRIRFDADVRLGDVVFFVMGHGQNGTDGSDWVSSSTGKYLTRLAPAAPVTKPPVTNPPVTKPPVTQPPVTPPPATKPPGNNPGPNGGSTPIPTPGTGTGTPPGGELATTGSSPATTWAIGGAGIALAMGAALVAGTGRHRRRDTTA